jgi:uncharacterized protein YecE (DUF72 family)
MPTAHFHIGTSGWTYDHWKGDFYPARLARSRWFAFYTERFQAVEVNATFYRVFPDATFKKWRAQVGAGFRYVLKAPRLITHEKHLLGCEEDIRALWHSAELLEDRLGVILLQVAPDTPCDLGRLKAALMAFEDPCRVAVEFRAECWQQEGVRALLEELGAAHVSVDAPHTRLSEWVTGPAAYIRLHGRKGWYNSNYTHEELEEIAALARRMQARGAQAVYIFFNNDVGGFAPHNALTLKDILGE